MAQGTVLLQNLITFCNNEGKCMIVVIIIMYTIISCADFQDIGCPISRSACHHMDQW